MILIGSRALLIRAPQLLNRSPRDFDFFGHEEEIFTFIKDFDLSSPKRKKNKILIDSEDIPCEFELIESSESAKLFESLVVKDHETITTDFGLVPNVNLLFTLKASHRFLKNSPHFWKTARDYHCLKAAGAVIVPEYQEFFSLREKETYTYLHPKLNVDKDNFFKGDQIEYVYDHDSIHEAMKHLDKPAYSFFQKDGAQVACDKNKFFALPEQTKIFSILEETYVLALERSQIPYPNSLTPRKSFLMALSKVCSSITSGWWRSYAYENIFNVLNQYDDNYLVRFENAIKSGVVKKI